MTFQQGIAIGTIPLMLCALVCARPPAVSAQVTQLVSVSSSGQQGNDISGRFSRPAISGNGRIITFDSQATTLVPGDTNLRVDVFVHDRGTSITERVSVSTGGIQGNGTSTRPAIDGAGDMIVYDSSANNLVIGDTNGDMDIFVRNRLTGTTERVSVSSDEVQGNDASYDPSITTDGRFVCFVSVASNLVPNDTNGAEDIFVRDLIAGTTERVSLGDAGQQSNSSSTLAAIGADGRWIAFISFADNLVPDDTNDQFDIFVHDRQTGFAERVNVSMDEEQANGLCSGPTISQDGRFVAFWADATNLVPVDTNDRPDVFVRDRLLGTTELVSVSSEEMQGNGNSPEPGVRGFLGSSPEITPDGRYIVFFSSSSNLVPGDTNTCPPSFQSPGACPDVFVRDLVAGTTTRMNLSADGAQANDRSADPSISTSGIAVAFFSAAGNLVPNDANVCPGFPVNCPDIFVHEALPTSTPTGEQSPVATLSVSAQPNPSTHAVALSITGPTDPQRTVVIYDVTGRVVRTLGKFESNVTTVLWDGKDDAGKPAQAGIYFCKVTSGSHEATARITFLNK